MGKELENVKSEKITLKIKGKDREIRFGFSAWSKLEEEYGGLKNLEKIQKEVEERPFSTIPHLLYLGLVDKEGVSEDTILDDYGLNDIQYISEVFNRAIYGSLPQADNSKTEVEA